MARVTVCAETDGPSGEDVDVCQRRIFTTSPCSPYCQWSVFDSDIAYPFDSAGMPTVRAMSANEMIQSGFDCVDWVYRFDQDPDLDHVSGFCVF